jgi:hypothetical protein
MVGFWGEFLVGGILGALPRAQVAKLVDALVSGTRARKGVKVRVLSWAPFLSTILIRAESLTFGFSN